MDEASAHGLAGCFIFCFLQVRALVQIRRILCSYSLIPLIRARALYIAPTVSGAWATRDFHSWIYIKTKRTEADVAEKVEQLRMVAAWRTIDVHTNELCVSVRYVRDNESLLTSLITNDY